MIKIYTAQEALQVNLGDGARHGPDGVHFGVERSDTTVGDCVAQKRHRAGTKNALIPVDGEPGRTEALKEESDVLDMSRPARRGHQNVVEIDEDEGQAAKHPVHQPLESLGGIFEPKGHPEELKKLEWRDDGRLLNVIFVHRDLVVSTH